MLSKVKTFQSFSASDVSAAKDFYENKLGLKVEEKFGGLQIHTNNSEPIMVYQKDNHEPATYTIHNFIVDDIEKAVDTLSEKGVKFEQYPEMNTNEKGISTHGEGPSMAWFKDPSENILGLLQEQ